MSSRLLVVAALGTAQMLGWGTTYYLPAILAEPMAGGLGVGAGWVYGAFSAALVVAMGLGPAAGRWIDLRGGRDVLATSSLVLAASLVILGTAGGPAPMVLGWLVMGVGMALGLYEAAFATLAGIYGRNARGAITGITLFAGFASTICWPITALLEDAFGWRAACLVWAGAHLLIGLPLNRLMLPVGTQPPAPPETKAANAAVRPDRAMLLLAFVFAVTWFISTAMATHLPRLLQEAGATPTAAIAAAALVGPAQVGARLLEFGLLRRFHPLLSARLAALAHPLGAGALMLVGTPATVAFALLHGAGNGILTIATGTLPLAIFGARGYGLRQGWLMAPARLAQAAAPFLFALLLARYGAPALLLTAALGLAGLVALLHLRSTTEPTQAARP